MYMSQFNSSLNSLRSLLDDVNRSPPPAYKASTSSYASPIREPYSAALTSAERSVDRLGKSIELAEEEMEMALKRTTGRSDRHAGIPCRLDSLSIISAFLLNSQMFTSHS